MLRHSAFRTRRALLHLISAASLVGLLLAGCSDPAEKGARHEPAQRHRLTVITPHNKDIRDAFGVAFGDWYDRKHKQLVSIDWVALGTPRCVSYVDQVFEAPPEARPVAIPDLMFGGGIADHAALADRGYLLPLSDVSAPVPAEVGGLPTRDEQGRWFATSLSTFGIVYHQRDCDLRGIAPPATWTDLADPRFFGWVGLADPRASGSNRQCLNLILQQAGWQDGWGLVLRILANARALMDSSGDVLTGVRQGVFLPAFAVNFDGQALGETSDGVVRYVNPAGATVITPDVVSVLRCARDADLAAEFVRFCLSREGQVLWSVPQADRATYGNTLYHYPIVPEIYQEYADRLSVPENPYEADFGLRLDLAESRWRLALLDPLVAAATGENHVQLQRAWRAAIEAGLPPAAVAELTSPPFDETRARELAAQLETADPAAAARLQTEWAAAFAAKYQRVLDMLAAQHADAGGGVAPANSR